MLATVLTATRHQRPVNAQFRHTAAHLARFDVRTRKLTMLPIPIIAEINGAFDAAWWPARRD